METTEAITITMLGVGLLLLFMLLVAVWRVGGSLLRMERLLAEHEGAAVSGAPLPAREAAAAAGAFAEFLAEDPGRRGLPKREQADAFRRWRRERGLNWSAS